VGNIHDFKKNVLKDAKVRNQTLSHYNVRQNPNTGELFLVPNNPNMPAIASRMFIK